MILAMPLHYARRLVTVIACLVGASALDIAGIIKQTGALDSIARQLGVPSAIAQQGADVLLPAILGGFKKQASPAGSGGLGGLADILSGGGGLLDAVNSPEPTPASPGNEILGQIFGSKDVSRTVAENASQSSGLDPALLKKMLPLLVMAVTGYLAQQSGGSATAGRQAAPSGGGILGQILGGVLGGGKGGAAAGTANAGGIGGLASLIDMNGDGNPLDDIMRMAGKFKR